MKKNIPTTLKIIIILGLIICGGWGFWIYNSPLKPNEFGDAINPIINLVTIFFLYLNWIGLKEQINEEKRKNKIAEDIKVGIYDIEVLKNEKGLVKYMGRSAGDIDPIGKIRIKIKNYGIVPAYFDTSKLTKYLQDGNIVEYKNIIEYPNNILLPGEEMVCNLKVQAPNQINSIDKDGRLEYEITFRNNNLYKTLELSFKYVGFSNEIDGNETNGIWFIPHYTGQAIE